MKRLATVVALSILASLTPAAHAGEAPAISSPQTCGQHELNPDGSRRQRFDRVDDTGQLAGLPPRVETGVRRGERASFCVAFQNRTGVPINLDLSVENIETDEAGRPGSTSESVEFGAASWIELATTKVVNLPHGEIAWIEVDASVPADAVTGSSYAAISATASSDAQVEDSGAIRVETIPTIALQVFFDVEGNRSHDGAIINARAPRVVWWDGLDLGDIPVLDDLRGLGVATVRFDWRNDGNLTGEIGGAVDIDADFGGRDVTELGVADAFVLRGATRSFEATWSDDIPLFGRFTPVIKLTDDAGNEYTKELDPIWVIPSWWYLLALVLAIGFPLWMRHRSKQRYRELLARVEAAEADRHDEEAYSDDEWA